MKLILRFLLGTLILVAALFIAFLIVYSAPEKDIIVPPVAQKVVEFMEVEYTINNFETPIQGRVQSRQKIDIFSEVSGPLKIGGKEFREGQQFKKGDAILIMDPSDQLNQIKSLRSSFLQLLTSNLADIKLDYPESFVLWEEYVENYDVSKSVSELPREQSQQEKLFLSNKGILNQYYNIRSAEDRLAKFTIHAPFTGKVTEALVTPGALVRVGQKMGAFANPESVEIEAAVGMESLDHLKIGDEVIFMMQKDTIIGLVDRISASLDPSTQTQKIFIEVEHPLVDGSYVSGVIISNSATPSMKIDSELIAADGTVYSVNDGVLVKSTPKILHQNGTEALIFGLPEGLTLISQPIASAYEGMEVKTSEE